MKKYTQNQFTKNFQPEASERCFYLSTIEYRKISTSRLQSSQGYQRPVDPNHVAEIVKSFNPLYLDEIIVSRRDNEYYVIDGQNRIAAFKHMNSDNDCVVHCKVFHCLTYEQEAEMFHHLDSIKKSLRFCDTIRAKTEAKTDPNIPTINKILHKYDVTWVLVGSGGSNNTVRASKTIMNTYIALGPHMFELVIRMLVRTWKGAKKSMSASFIEGLALFVQMYVHEAKEDVFVKKLSSITPDEIKSLARAEFSATTNAQKYARVFLAKYNQRGGSGKLPYRFD